MLTHNQILSLCQTLKQRPNQNHNMEDVYSATTRWLAKALGPTTQNSQLVD
jgi:hypothetical protein